jgi:uncharacterized protein with FMN-binding domain
MPDADAYSTQLSEQVRTTLREEVLQAQSTDVDMVSGATYSSTAYLDSLQSALDRAGGSTLVPVLPTTPSVLPTTPSIRPTTPRVTTTTSTAAPATASWYVGDVVPVQWGDVQVRVQLEGTRITDVQTLAMPDGDAYSTQLSEQVRTTLREEVLQAQSADVDMVSGATYSSTAYLQSLQSALDKSGVETTGGPSVVPTASGGATTTAGLTETDTVVTAEPSFTG